MKRLLLYSLIILPRLLQAQSFVPVPFPVEGNRTLERTALGSIAFADVDGDSDLDLLITGENSTSTRVAKLYTNNGEGGFTEIIETPFEGTGRNSISLADIDGDNDLDILITGLNRFANLTAKIYTNDGTGKFRERVGHSLKEASYSSVAFADIDGDNDQDLLITGETIFDGPIAELYTNNGTGKFAKIPNTPFEGVYFSSIAFADVDGDNDQDVLITGKNSSLIRVAKLYTNDGKGDFTEMVNTPFEGVSASSIAFADIDGDNDQDILITGLNDSLHNISKLYTNNGKGGFTEMPDVPFEGVYRCSVAFADVDRDNDQDILITGQNNSSKPTTTLYSNNGKGSFAKMTDTPLEGVFFGSIAFADVDGDKDPDLVITGLDSVNEPTTTLYINTLRTSASVESHQASEKMSPLLFPNPSVNTPVTLSYSAEKFGELSISVSDVAGETLLRQQATVSEGENSILLDCAALPKGTYIVELKQEDRSTSTKLVIQ